MIRKLLRRTNLLINSVAFLILFSCGSEEGSLTTRVLPILGERDVEYLMKNGEEVADTIYHRVPSFSYLNQDSVMISSEDLKSKVWVADFFFSHCPSICPPMTANMKRLSLKTQDLKEKVEFLSFSIDPERDTPTRLREYKKQYGIEVKNWQFFTGNEEETHLLAKEFFNGAERDEEAEGGFGHTSYFAIVDTEGLVRGIYDGTNSEEVDRLEKDLRKLLKHEYGHGGSK